MFHHDVHHAAYVNNMNAFLASGAAAANSTLQNSSLARIVQNVGTSYLNLSPAQTTLVRNNAGGHFNHALFWRIMAENGTSATVLPAANSSFIRAVDRDFGNLTSLISAVNAAGAARFGSGWSWVVYNTTGKKLVVLSTANQDVPIMQTALGYNDLLIPILGLDVWEHAYYLRYGPKRASYLSAWWTVVNWQQVQLNFLVASDYKAESDFDATFNHILGPTTNIRAAT